MDVSSPGDFLVLYGSQTGQAKAISEILVDRCQKLGLTPRLYELDQFGKKFHLEKESLVVVICSTTGSGDAPDNAARFVRWISRSSQPANLLKGTTFALLGLGDTNYTTFQAIPLSLQKHFLRLGATKLLETGAADDQVGLDLAVEPWLNKVVLKLVTWFRLPVEGLKKLSLEVPANGNEAQETAVSGSLSTFGSGVHSKMIEPEDMSFEEAEDEEEEEPSETLLKASKVVWPVDKPCLVKGSGDIGKEELQVPVAPATYLTSSVTHEKFEANTMLWQNGFDFPGANSEIFDARVVGTIELTKPDAVTVKREIQIDIAEAVDKVCYEPGDAFYFIAPNPREEVNFILEKMNLLVLADQKCFVRVHPRTEKRNASLPGYIPEISSLRYIFTYCLDIRRPPSRPLLRSLAEQTRDEGEKRRLLELCSAQGSKDFATYVQQAGLSLADLLFAFPSCQPSPDRLMELLPRLQPRPYSVACSKTRWGSRLRFIYSLMLFPVENGRRYERYGLASGWLAGLKIGDYVKVMLKNPARFRLPPPSIQSPDIRQIPLIMIGPGTGIAPFLSFLQQIYELNVASDGIINVERELYFGCRRLDVDCFCRDEIEFYKREKILSHLEICESQPKDGQSNRRPKYVQDALQLRGKQIVECLTRKVSENEQPLRVYVCGDAKGMAKDVWAAFIKIIVEHSGKTEEDAKQFMEDLKNQDRYLEDVWA